MRNNTESPSHRSGRLDVGISQEKNIDPESPIMPYLRLPSGRFSVGHLLPTVMGRAVGHESRSLARLLTASVFAGFPFPPEVIAWGGAVVSAPPICNQ